MALTILLVGSGAREHAIARALKRSKHKHVLASFASHENPGIKKLSHATKIGNVNNIEAISQYAEKHHVDFAIIGPELPLSMGIVDKLQEQGIPSIGPSKQHAQIETSKAFARDLLARYNIPGSPRYQHFHNLTHLLSTLEQFGKEYVIKANGLMGGKGVQLSGEHLPDHKSAVEYCQSLLKAGHQFVVEEKLIGQEFSLMSFTDGKHLAHMPAIQDHKRAFENDIGMNTGGMGSYSSANHSLPFLNQDNIQQAQAINEATTHALSQEFNSPYKGILYGGFMLTKEGVKLIEYNARFGDPEAINTLALLETDFIEICQAILEDRLDQVKVTFSNHATVCKYCVPLGYPDTPQRDKEIDLRHIENNEELYYASIKVKNHSFCTHSSRTLAILGIAESILDAEKKAESLAKQIKGSLYHRKDIGTASLINKRIEQINQLCHTDYLLL